MTRLYFCGVCKQEFESNRARQHGTYIVLGNGNIQLYPCSGEIKCRVDEEHEGVRA